MLRDVFPSLRDLPAVIAFYALWAFIFWAVIHNDRYRALLADIVSRTGFWQLICAGLLLFLAGAGIAFWQSEKDA